MNTPILIALVVATLGPLLTYIAAVRRLSGKIGTSAAEDLWEESRAIRGDLAERNEFLHLKIEQCEKRLEAVEKRNRELRDEVYELRAENRRLEKELERISNGA